MNVDIGARIGMLVNKQTAEDRAKAQLKLDRKEPTPAPTNQRKPPPPPAPPKKVARRIQSRG